MKVSFTTTRLREAYDMADVDHLLDRIEPALRGEVGSITPQHLREVRFATSRFSEGYDTDEVDTLLDRVLLPILEGRRPYDPEHDYTPELVGPPRTEQPAAGATAPAPAPAGHPAERGGFLSRWQRGR